MRLTNVTATWIGEAQDKESWISRCWRTQPVVSDCCATLIRPGHIIVFKSWNAKKEAMN